ncbi:MAG: hypothetical protein M0D57_06120 [Sphingobacteriales bacterium JAD_PAG50586_3]|nr:MAG: hypothetical protein M0D57_06120 [Sphingobacteriales bacterium JAD_PAG50586_3]
MKKAALIIVFTALATLLNAQQADTGKAYIKRYFAELQNKPLTNYTGAVAVLNLYSCGRGTLCGSELQEFAGKFAATTTMPVYIVLLGNDTAVEKCFKKLPDVTFLNGDYDLAQNYGLGFSVHHFYKLNNGVITFYAIPDKKNEKKVRKAFSN